MVLISGNPQPSLVAGDGGDGHFLPARGECFQTVSPARDRIDEVSEASFIPGVVVVMLSLIGSWFYSILYFIALNLC